MVKKIKRQMHPDWFYFSDENVTRTVPPSTEIVFFWTKHSSHKLMQKVLSQLPPNVEVLYVTATNLEALEAEMKKEYWIVLEKKKNRKTD